MFETIAVTIAASAVVFLPLGALYGHSVAAHASTEASAIKTELKTKLAIIVGDIKTWDDIAKEGTESVIAQFEGRIKQIL